MPVTRWTLYNPAKGEVQHWPRNPTEGVLPQKEKTIDAQTTTAPDGQPLIFEGREKVRRFPFSGTIRNKQHLDFMNDWYAAKVSCLVTDELGNSWWLYLVSFKAKRRNRHNNPWSATYEAEAIVTG